MATEQPGNDVQNPGFHLESLDRVMKLPLVEAAYNQGASVYKKIKGANYILNWAFTTAETSVTKAVETATPLIHKLDKPINMVDQQLVKGIQALEVRAPVVTQQPQQIYEAAKTAVTDKISAAKSYGEQQAVTLKDLSYNKANEILTTHYGKMAVSGIDSTSAMAERLIDHYFPSTDETQNITDAPISATEDPVLHTVQTVGRLSNKAARQVYANVSNHLSSLKVQDVKEYISTLVAVLQLTQILHYIGQGDKVEKKEEPKPQAENEPNQENNAQ